MKMSINFPTICRQRVCHVVLPPNSHAHTHTQTSTPTHKHTYMYTHTVACHTQCQLQIEFICWRQILTWQTHFYFILFAFLFHSLLMVCMCAPSTPAPDSALTPSSFFSIFIQLHLWRLVPWPSPKTFANHVFAFISSSSLPAPDVPLPVCVCGRVCVDESVCAGGLKWHINFQRGNEIIEMKLSPEAWAGKGVSQAGNHLDIQSHANSWRNRSKYDRTNQRSLLLFPRVEACLTAIYYAYAVYD